METKAIHTHHSRKRCQQRGITQQMIDDTLHHGDVIHKQGLRFYVMAEKNMCFLHQKQYNERVKNTVVVLTENDVIITVYKNSKALKQIRKKPKAWSGEKAEKRSWSIKPCFVKVYQRAA